MQVYKLNNGIRVASEKLPYLKSISVGIWVGAGCFAEDEKNNGISHFIEHMLFKGTKKRSAAEIAGCIDALGGVLNAFTAKECTCFYVNILSEHYGVAIDLLCDMLINSRFDKDDIAREAGVVCEEIAMVEDTPDDLANENLARAYYGSHPLGQTILGSAENVRSFSADMIKEYMNRVYVPKNIVVSVAGNYDEKAVIDMLNEKLTVKGFDSVEKCPPLKKEKGDIIFVQKDIEQVNLCLGFPGMGQTAENYFAATMAGNILGGGMSSRLFQRVREKNGMTYAIYSYLAANVNSGMLTVYAGMNQNQAADVLDLISDEIEAMRRSGITDKEYTEAKEQLKGGFVLGLESAGARMNRNGKVLLLNGRVLTQEEVLREISDVSKEEINKTIAGMLDFSRLSAASVGRCSRGDALYKKLTALKNC